MKLSVIVPNLDTPTVDRAVDSIVAQRMAAADEIIVVGRDRPGRLRGRRGLRLIETSRPLLPGAARNLGMRAATGDIFVFLDADCVATPEWLAAHRARHADGATVVGGGVLWDDDNLWTMADNLAMFHAFRSEMPSGDRTYVPTLNLSVSRRAAASVGGMDPALRCGEDLDWTIRLAKAGHQPLFAPEAAVWHRPPRSTITSIWIHHHRTGRWMPGVRRRYPEVFGTPGWFYHPLLLGLMTPLVAAAATARIVACGAGSGHGRVLPVVFLAKVAWCVGALRPMPVDPVAPVYALE